MTIEKGFETDNFISGEECEKLITYQQKYGSNDRETGSRPRYYVGEYVYDKQATGDDSIPILVKYIHTKICYFMQQSYNEELYLEFSNLVYWAPGMELDVHVDNFNIHDLSTLNNNRFMYRDYSFFLYLNGEFGGGELWFPRQNDYKIKPKAGKLVFFPGGSRHMHGVTKITSGKRYVMAGWFTKTKRKSILNIRQEEMDYFKNYRGPLINPF